MLSWPTTVRIYVSARPADMRRGFDGLARMTIEVIKQDPTSGALFVFRNRRGDRLKVLYWAGDELRLQLVLAGDLGLALQAGEDFEDDLGLELWRERPASAFRHGRTLLGGQY